MVGEGQRIVPRGIPIGESLPEKNGARLPGSGAAAAAASAI